MWYQEREEGILIFVKVTAGARKNEIIKWAPSASFFRLNSGTSFGAKDFLKIKITAPREKGKANEALCDFLGKKFGIAKSQVRIVKGQTKSLKIIFLPVNVDQLKQILQ